MKKSLNSPIEMLLYTIGTPMVWLIFLPISWAAVEKNSGNIFVFLFFLLLGPTIIFVQWRYFPIRHIEFDEKFIYVLEYFNKKNTTIPISEIEKVSDFWIYRLASIKFKDKTQIGNMIWFIPIQPNWIGFREPNPLLTELSNNVTKSKVSSST